MLKRRKLVMRTGRRITFTSSFICAYLTRMKWENSSLLPVLTAFPIRACTKDVQEFKNSNFPQESNVPPALYSFAMHLWIIQSGFNEHRVLPRMNCLRDCVTRPGCCMDADVLFMGEATLRKIFCLQETLRGVGGRPPLRESLLQPDRVLFLPSPLLRDKTAASQTPDKRVSYHLTPALSQQLLQMQALISHTDTHTQTHTHTHTRTDTHTLIPQGTYFPTSPLRDHTQASHQQLMRNGHGEPVTYWKTWTQCAC